jgi:rhamnogalacturonyl hydrolase YesR
MKLWVTAVALGSLAAGLVVPTAATAATTAAVAPAALPSHAVVVNAEKSAASYYRTTFAHTTLTPTNGWSWATYFQGLESLYAQAGDASYLGDAMGWGRSRGWSLLTSGETNPDTVKAAQVYDDLNRIDPSASLTATDARMSTDLAGLPVTQYDWADALFMGLANWPRAARRTANPKYLDKMDALYAWSRDQGATSARCAGKPVAQPGLFDAAQGLWYRDCTFVGAVDANGQPVFWSRGNGWVVAAMADVLQALPPGDARAASYTSMLQDMAARLVRLQGPDGFWRASLADPALLPQPETSGTALITYALAYGVKAGILDPATYLPAIARAWQGMTAVALQPNGFLSGCQGPGVGPAASFAGTAPRTPPTATSSGTVNSDSPPYCVGAFLLAGGAVAALVPSVSTGEPVTSTSQQPGNEAGHVDDGDLTTRWSASGFPQSVVIDLGASRTISSSMLVPYLNRAYQYRIATSGDGATWRTVVDQTASTATGSSLQDFTGGPVSARYVRLTVTGVDGGGTTWASIEELAVYAAPAAPVVAADSFGRTVSAGLGTADTGGPWVVGGSAASFAVGGGAARLTMSAPGAGPAAFLDSVSSRDVVVRADASLSEPPTGGGTYVALVGRHLGSSDYRAKVRWTASGAVTLGISRVVGGVETTLRTVVVPTPSSAVTVRFEVTGSGVTTLSARVWRTGSAEPPTWQVSTTDTTAALQRPGGIGLWSYLSSGATNSPVTATFDNLLATG